MLQTKEATLAQSTQARTWRAAAVVAFALVIALIGMCATTVQAWAADVTVALTAIDATNNNKVVVNQKVVVDEQATVADVLAKAGFMEGTQEESAASPDSVYFTSYNAPYFLGKGYDADAGTWWVSGSDNDDAPYAYLTDTVAADCHYQYIYGGTTDPTTYRLQFKYTSDYPDPLSFKMDEEAKMKMDTLGTNLVKRFSMGRSDGIINSNTCYAAFALAALDKSYNVDTSDLGSKLESDQLSGSLSAGRLAKYILAFAAGGDDATNAKINGKRVDLVTQLKDMLAESNETISLYDLVWILPVCQNYSKIMDADVAADLIDQLYTYFDADECLFDGGYGFDLQTSAQAVLALAPYADTNDKAAEMVIDTMLELVVSQNADGGFSYSPDSGVSDLDTTAAVIAAAAAVGLEPDSDILLSNNGSDPAAFMLSKANDSLTGFVGEYDEAMGSATALMGMAAYQKAVSTQDVVNVLDFTNVPVVETFPDVVNSNVWYFSSVYRAAEKGLVKGYGTGNFGPADTLTRAQAAVILWRFFDPEAEAAYVQADAKNETGMADVADAAYYTGAANWAVKNGVIKGEDDGNGGRAFNPNGTITREQLCTIMGNAAEALCGATIEGGESTLANMPDASSVSTWATAKVAWSLGSGVINGADVDGTKYVQPQKAVTRAEMAAILMNAIDNDIITNE